MASYHIVSFLKFGSEENIYDLYRNGTIYMNPIDAFRKTEDNELRGDSYDGICKIHNIPGGEFEVPALQHKGKFLHLHLKESSEYLFGNIYSLYCISSHGFASPEAFAIDERVKRFGSHFLFVKDNVEFMRRVRQAFQKAKIKFWEGFVEYYDKMELNGETNLFQKPLEFAYQKEFRFYADTKSLEPLVLRVGSLEGIAEVYRTDLIGELKLVSKKQVK